VWGALAILVGFVLQKTLKLQDHEVSLLVDAFTTILMVAGPGLILWGRVRLQPRLDALAVHQVNQSPQGVTQATEEPVAQSKE